MGRQHVLKKLTCEPWRTRITTGVRLRNVVGRKKRRRRRNGNSGIISIERCIIQKQYIFILVMDYKRKIIISHNHIWNGIHSHIWHNISLWSTCKCSKSYQHLFMKFDWISTPEKRRKQGWAGRNQRTTRMQAKVGFVILRIILIHLIVLIYIIGIFLISRNLWRMNHTSKPF